MRRAITLVAGAVALMVAASAHADLVANGGFETGNFTGWTLSGNTGGSLVSGNLSFVHTGDYAGWFGPSSANGGLSQTITASANSRMLITFWLSNGGDTTNINFFEASIGGQNLVTLTNAVAFGYTQYSFDVVVAAANPTLEFEFLNVPAFFFLDDISAVTLVPLPPGAAIGVAGLAGIAGLNRWRRRRILTAR